MTISSDGTVLRVSRVLMREALVRRRLVGRATLGSLVSDDDIFTLSAYPAMMPFWRQVSKWGHPIRNEEISDTEAFYSRRLALFGDADRYDTINLIVDHPPRRE
jgi:hypothetical protein